jgi:hypothetical protein
MQLAEISIPARPRRHDWDPARALDGLSRPYRDSNPYPSDFFQLETPGYFQFVPPGLEAFFQLLSLALQVLLPRFCSLRSSVSSTSPA